MIESATMSELQINQGDAGRFYEDYEVGQHFQSPIGRTITEADNVWFTLLTLNNNQLHFNSHYAQRTEFKGPIVNSGVTLAIVLGMTVADISRNAMANLGWDEIRLLRPVHVGDTLYVESLVLSARESRSHANAGIVEFRSRGLNQEGHICIDFQRTVMIYKRGHSPVDGLFPSPEFPIVSGGWESG